jgi:hypothetical protein
MCNHLFVLHSQSRLHTMADGLRKGCMIHVATALTSTHRRAAAADTLRDILLDDNKYVPAWVTRGKLSY